jgi:hypothetical protein
VPVPEQILFIPYIQARYDFMFISERKYFLGLRIGDRLDFYDEKVMKDWYGGSSMFENEVFIGLWVGKGA